MTTTAFHNGDKVRHNARPEWGIGSILKVEMLTREGKPDQRLWIRFPNIGTKTLLASAADLEITNEVVADVAQSIHARPTLAQVEMKREGGWLGKASSDKPEAVMTALSPQATDPFLSLRKRLEVTLSQYRFEATGARLVDWAVAQSGIDDPLSRFNRQELEQFHAKWRFELDAHLGKLLLECRREPDVLAGELSKAPPLAQRAVQKFAACAKRLTLLFASPTYSISRLNQRVFHPVPSAQALDKEFIFQWHTNLAKAFFIMDIHGGGT